MEDQRSQSEQPGRPIDRWRRPALVVASVLVVVAVGFTAWSGWLYYSASHDDTLQYAAARDDVLRVGQQELINFYSLDYQNPGKSFDQMLAQATGPLADTLKQNKDAWTKQIQDGKASLSVQVLDAAVSGLDNRAGSASIVAMLQFVTKPDTGQPVSSRVPMQGGLSRTDSGWKLNQALRIPLGAQGQ